MKAKTIIEIPKYDITSENIHSIVQKKIGIVFTKVLEDAGVYKRTPDGIAAFNRFIDNLKKGPFHFCEMVCKLGIQVSQSSPFSILCMIYMFKVISVEY